MMNPTLTLLLQLLLGPVLGPATLPLEVQAISNAIIPLLALIVNTPVAFTTGNAVVNGLWMTMTGVTDAMLGLYVMVKLIQMMYGDATGTTHLPMGQFLAKVLLTIILIHASAFLGQQLLTLVNALCEVVITSLGGFINQVNGGHPFTVIQNLGVSTVLVLIAGLSLLRVVLQAIKRIVFFNVLYILSGPAFLMSLDVQTAPWFQFWLRTYLTNILTQFFQFLTFGLGLQFLLSTKQTGFTGFVLAIAILNLTAEIPSLLSRFASSPATSVPGLGDLVRSGLTAAQLLI